MLSIPQLATLLDRFDPEGDERSNESRLRTLDLLKQGTVALSRQNYHPGHITASGIVLSSTHEEVLLVFHQKLGRWLQPGGHIEPEDQSVADAAAREIREETGAVPSEAIPPRLVGIDVHQIPATPLEPAHLHHDVVWSFVADRVSTRLPAEPTPVVWCPRAQLTDRGVDAALLRAVQRCLTER